MKPELYKRRPKKFLGKRAGLFGRQLKDELKEHYHEDQVYETKSKDNTSKSKNRKGLFYIGGPDWVIEIIAVGLIIIFLLFFVLGW